MSNFFVDGIKEKCTGCSACYNICPQKCVTLKSDKEGFNYPIINKDECINCKLCEKVCPLNDDHICKVNDVRNFYAAKNKNSEKVKTSSSGGIFDLVSDYVLSKNGVVFGAKYDEDFNVVHGYTEDEVGRDKFKGAKYVQSIIGDNFIKVKEFLNKKRLVLFTGTPCQIEGLNSFLNKEYENLITMDIICHGVPSPRVYNDYIKLKEKEYNSKLEDITFRNKELGWKAQAIKMKFENKSVYTVHKQEDLFYKLFLQNIILRPSCYTCKFTNLKRVSDISIGDFWGIELFKPNLFDDKGISLLLVNTKKGENILEIIKDNLISEISDAQQALEKQVNLREPSPKNKKRELYFSLYNKVGFEITNYCLITLPPKIKSIIKINR